MKEKRRWRMQLRDFDSESRTREKEGDKKKT